MDMMKLRTIREVRQLNRATREAELTLSGFPNTSEMTIQPKLRNKYNRKDTPVSTQNYVVG
jgi:hypothetical protein